MKQKPLVTSKLDWYGEKITLEFFDSVSFERLCPVTQVQAVCFINENKIVLYKSGRGNYGCPGGTIEKGESFEEALAREIHEEVAGKMIVCGRIGYLKETREKSGKVKYLLRYWVKIRLLDEAISDPCDDARSRHVFKPEEAIDKLNWDEMGKLIIERARENFLNS